MSHALFVDRPNRFVVRCEMGGKMIRAYLPNPGRLSELLLPGATMHIIGPGKEQGTTRRTKYTAVAVDREGVPIMLQTHLTNAAARFLVEHGLVPGLTGARIVRPEVTVGRSRFDFLLKHRKKPVLLEVKSCTLVSGQVAMFPDAVTARGRRHILELAELRKDGYGTAVLFVVHWPKARLFSPDYHTDLAFSEALCHVRKRVNINALAVGWDHRLRLRAAASPCTIPWKTIEKELGDRGSYMVLLRLPRLRRLSVGSLGSLPFPKGYYLYVGSAMAHLSKRIERHRRVRRKAKHWHIDSLREAAQWEQAWPFRSSERLECSLADAVASLADWTTQSFGSSDCGCSSHLFGFHQDPRSRHDFQEMIARFRMDRLVRLVSSKHV